MNVNNFTRIKIFFRKVNKRILQISLFFAIIPVSLLIFIALAVSIYLYVENMLETEGRNEANLIVQDYAHQMETELLMYLEIEKQFNFIFSNYENMNINFRRKFYADLTLELIKKNEQLLSTWADFDRNALDGQDNKYKSIGIFPRSGRFNCGWHRGNGEIEVELEHPNELIENLLEDDYYALPRKIGKTIMLEPYYYDYAKGTKGSGILMTSIASPVFNKNNKIVGVTGIDISLENYVELTEKIKPFGVGYATLYSSEGYLLSHPNKELIGKNITNNPDFSTIIADSIYMQILKKQPFEMNTTDKDGKEILVIFVPVATGIEGEKLMLGVYVPYEAILAKIFPFFIRLIAIIGIALAFVVGMIVMFV
jgi:methyl-accepting chemotaxis protein